MLYSDAKERGLEPFGSTETGYRVSLGHEGLPWPGG